MGSPWDGGREPWEPREPWGQGRGALGTGEGSPGDGGREPWGRGQGALGMKLCACQYLS